MAICKKQAPRIKDFLGKLKEIEPILDKVLHFTGEVQKLKENPTIEMIDALVPDDTALQGYLNLALNAITGGADAVSNIATKLKNWLNGKTELQVNADLIKLASVATALGHKAENGKQYRESFYDLAAQGSVYGIKPEEK